MFRQLSERLQLTPVPDGGDPRYYYNRSPLGPHPPAVATAPPIPPEQVAEAIFNTHPAELQIYLEPPNVPPFLPFQLATLFPAGAARGLVGVGNRQLRWHHLIYAYMIENTKVYEVFRRVLLEYRQGEKLGAPLNAATQNWLTATEQLFYSEPAPFAFTNVSSHVRPDMRANRRNAYQRMFGMELNHQDEDGKAYPFKKAEANNSEFVSTAEEFLREVWVGIANAANTSGARPTDDAKIAELATKLRNMLLSRRISDNLAREEFAYVSTMQWFHLTLQFNSPIVGSLRAEADGPENRLFKIAERVGLPAHGLSRHFFQIADPIARLLILIELGIYSNVANVPVLYVPGAIPGANPVAADLAQIITHWTAITGRDVKARKVTVT